MIWGLCSRCIQVISIINRFELIQKIPSEFQDEFIHNISLAKLYELTKQMPNYVSVATQTSFLAVTNDLVGIVSYMVDSINYPVYFGGLSSSSGSFCECVTSLHRDDCDVTCYEF